MTAFQISGLVLYLLLILLLLIFAIYSRMEKERLAGRRALIGAVLLSGLGWLPLAVFPGSRTIFFGGCLAGGLALGIGLAISPRPRAEQRMPGEVSRIDERDVVFSRFDLEKGTARYDEYYARNSRFLNMDEDIRFLPDLEDSSHTRKNRALYGLAEACQTFLVHQLPIADGEPGPPPDPGRTPDRNSALIKGGIRYLGADLCGIADLDRRFLYSHVGRGPEPYGAAIDSQHDFAIVFAVEMEMDMIAAAPQPSVYLETEIRYVDSARISMIAAAWIRRLGYSARAHIAGSNYHAMLPPLAWKAGLGELGRIGILLTERFGPRVRLGLVTTDMPLLTDSPRSFGVQDFCSNCRKCASNCPSQAIPDGDPVMENGSVRWVIRREACYRFWRTVGSDCARCIFVCPYSKPDNTLHGMIRWAAARSRAAQRISSLGDDLFYGRRPRRRPIPFNFTP